MAQFSNGHEMVQSELGYMHPHDLSASAGGYSLPMGVSEPSPHYLPEPQYQGDAHERIPNVEECPAWSHHSDGLRGQALPHQQREVLDAVLPVAAVEDDGNAVSLPIKNAREEEIEEGEEVEEASCPPSNQRNVMNAMEQSPPPSISDMNMSMTGMQRSMNQETMQQPDLVYYPHESWSEPPDMRNMETHRGWEGGFVAPVESGFQHYRASPEASAHHSAPNYTNPKSEEGGHSLASSFIGRPSRSGSRFAPLLPPQSEYPAYGTHHPPGYQDMQQYPAVSHEQDQFYPHHGFVQQQQPHLHHHHHHQEPGFFAVDAIAQQPQQQQTYFQDATRFQHEVESGPYPSSSFQVSEQRHNQFEMSYIPPPAAMPFHDIPPTGGQWAQPLPFDASFDPRQHQHHPLHRHPPTNFFQ
jgi:hypothetical protein